jgi:hypothetical protein
MRLPGRLSATTLGDLIGSAHRDRTSGVLELIEVDGPSRGRVHRIHFRAGLVSRVETALRVPRVGAILEEQGFIGNEALRHLDRELTRSPQRRAGEILVDDARLSPNALSAALRRQLRQKLDALFTLKDAEIRFRVARPEAERSIPLSPREFLHGRARKRDGEAAPSARPRTGREQARARALAVLGLGPDASAVSVQRAFRAQASAVHPDRHPKASNAERASLLERFALLSAAYHSLVA